MAANGRRTSRLWNCSNGWLIPPNKDWAWLDTCLRSELARWLDSPPNMVFKDLVQQIHKYKSFLHFKVWGRMRKPEWQQKRMNQMLPEWIKWINSWEIHWIDEKKRFISSPFVCFILLQDIGFPWKYRRFKTFQSFSAGNEDSDGNANGLSVTSSKQKGTTRQRTLI